MIGRSGEGRAPTFRRRLVALRRRRTSRLHRLSRPLLRLLLVLSPFALGVSWLLTSPAFALRALEIDGGARLERSWVESALEPHFGRNLLRLSLVEVQGQLRAHPWVKRVELSKQLPDRLRLAVIEHQPVALFESPRGLAYLSAEGQVITLYQPTGGEEPSLLVRYVDPYRSGGERSAASAGVRSELRRVLRLVRQLEESGAAWADGLLAVEILSPQDFRLWVRSLPFAILVRAGGDGEGTLRRGRSLDEAPATVGGGGPSPGSVVDPAYGALLSKCVVLDDLLPQIMEHFPTVAMVDLRFSRRIVLRSGAVRAAPGDLSPGGAV